ncbi:MAG: nucleotide-binding protein [Chlorobaculum sp.]|jgi:predicted nucleotide-binding protein|nr:nucleotide-binding protein [Chlorobaculum sp.]
MAKAQSPQRKPASLSVEQMKAALPKLTRRIADLEAFDITSVRQRGDSGIDALHKKVNSTLQEILGADTIEYREYSWPSFDTLGLGLRNGFYISEIQSDYSKNKDRATKRLSALKELFEERIADAETLPMNPTTQPSQPPKTGKVFIVHGHDHGAKDSVARLITKLGLEPVILHEQLDQSRTVIEKLLDHAAEADYAIALFTPDDIGHSAEHPEAAKPRARQNVVFELGFFLGLLGRKKVALLHKSDVEIPSDYSGVLYLPIDSGDGWKFRLAREMKACGMEIDMNKV